MLILPSGLNSVLRGITNAAQHGMSMNKQRPPSDSYQEW
jgi:hypothetical protein